VKITDSCGSISKAADASGVLALGSGSGTDCTTPGSGGAGNTHSARTQFYALNRAKEVARGWLPSNSWINAADRQRQPEQTCNATGTARRSILPLGRRLRQHRRAAEHLAHEYGHA
jgi:hypothetical protein